MLASVGKALEAGLALLDELTGASSAFAAARAAGFWISLEVVGRALAALFLVACALLFCLSAVRWLLPRAGLPLRWATIFGLGTWLATAGFHLLRALGIFQLWAAIVCCGALAAIAVRGHPSLPPWRSTVRRETRAARAAWRLLIHGRYSLANGLFLGLAALFVLRGLIIPPLAWDTLTYHGTRAIIWVQSGNFTFDPGPGPFSMYRHFFGGSELLMAWAMLPFRSDLLANLPGSAGWLGLGLAAWALARALGIREPFAASAAGASMFVSTILLELNSGYVEIALNFALLLGIALATYGLRRSTGPALLLSAMSIGTAAGTKLTGAPAGAVVSLVLLAKFVFSRETTWRNKATWLALSLGVAALPVVPWMVLAWRESGYPLSPLPVEVLGIKLGVADAALRWHQEVPKFEPYVWEQEKGVLLRVFYPLSTGRYTEAFGALALLPILAAPFGALVLIRRRPLQGLLLSLTTLTALGSFFSVAMTTVRLKWPDSSARFLLLFLLLAIPLSLAWTRPRFALAQAYRRALWLAALASCMLALRWGWGVWEPREAVIIAIVITAFATLAGWAIRRDPRSGLGASALLFAVACSVLQLRRDETRSAAFHQSFALHPFLRYWADGVDPLDDPRTAHRIAITGGEHQDAPAWFFYPFFGRRLQNEITYVPATKDGGIAQFGPFGDFSTRKDLTRWEERLDAARIDHVISFFPRSIEQDLMEAAPQRFVKIAGDFHWG
ncbi:MAG TPA: hypothetical protein VG963_00115, partial [Polyangiaceae bacterium]|nr:hypothetical protein [Polyangiaceae bacterium]